MHRVTRYLGLAIALIVLWIAVWIYLPAPTYFLLTFGVGGPEVSHWLIFAALASIALTAGQVSQSRVALTATALSVVVILLALGVWVRVPGTIRAFDRATRSMSLAPATPRRAKAIVVADLFRGIDLGTATVTRGVPFKTVDGNRQLTADIYRPPRSGPHPIVVQIYGGAWQRGQPSDFANFATWMAASGYVVFAIDYRHAPRYR